ncbi:hypothetical protein M5K25_014494 [Dendrobium thyrsiflorum]|uniref:Uncharacterized protein n=1 Tax=Dendrobium thyrsiflorum TaxID=117978 RepID=A0ABD0UVN3_DENTH
MRMVGKKMVFLVVRQFIATVQCMLALIEEELMSLQVVKYATSLSRESIIYIEGEAIERLEAFYSTPKELALAGSLCFQHQPSLLEF